MTLKDNIENLLKSIPSDVQLIAASKTRTAEEIDAAYRCGVRIFGENKVQELMDKFEKVKEPITWHLIGHLQSNKVKYIVGKVDLIHSLDSIKLLNEIEKKYSSSSLIANCLIQINIGKESSKDGIMVEELETLLNACENCNNVKVKGLMAIVPKGTEKEVRYYFKEMKKIFKNLKLKNFKNIKMEYLSMGMSSDYKTAIEEGSNMIRCGEKLFGKRIYNKGE